MSEDKFINQSTSEPLSVIELTHSMDLTNLNEADLKHKEEVDTTEKKSYRRISILSFIIFTKIAMTAAIIIVYLTIGKPTYICKSNFTPIRNDDSNGHDSHPSAVTTADFNHDHFIDIAVVNSAADTIGIFLNLGNGSFTSQKTFETGDRSKPISINSADLNNDTHLDLVVTNYDAHNIGLFFGYGNGEFSKQETIFVGASRPLSITISDLNNDNYLDLITTNNGTNSIGIFFGYGNGKFYNQIVYSTGYDSFPYSTIVYDFNIDTYPDIAVVNYGTDNIMIFLGNGRGNFSDPLILSTGAHSNPRSIVTNDFNHDNYPDIAVVNSGKHTIGIFLGRGNASFTTQITYFISSESFLHSIAIGDFNGDNQMDIVVCNSFENNLHIFIGYENGSFATPTVHSTGIDSNPMGFIVNDFDNDNYSDIVVTNFATNNIIVLIKYSLIQSQEQTSYAAEDGSIPYQILTGDFNNDNKLDLAMVNYGTSNIGVYLGYGNGSFSDEVTYSTSINSHPRGFTMADLDNDSYLDFVSANYNSQSIGILYGYGNGSFAPAIIVSTGIGSSIRSVIIDYFNDDNYLDIVVGDYGLDVIGVLFGNSNRFLSNLTRFSTGRSSRPIALAAADFNKDHYQDLVVANYGTDSVTIFLGSSNGNFQMFNTYITGDSSLPRMITIADLNQDNNLDIIIANYGTNIISIFFGLGNMSFSSQVKYFTGPNAGPICVLAVDLNNDSYLDIAVANQKLNNLGIFIGNGQGNFSDQSIYSTGPNSSPYSLAIGDFNGDKQLDIATANYGTNAAGVLLGHPTKTNSEAMQFGNYYTSFQSENTYSTGSSSLPYSMDVADMNNDNYLDFIVANSGTENIEIFLGYPDGSYVSDVNYPTGIGSNPKYIIVTDFNHDNLMDVVVTNPRHNNIIVLLEYHERIFSKTITYPTGIGSNPTALAIADLNNDKYTDLIVANKDTGNIGVFFGYNYVFFAPETPQACGDSTGPYSVAVGDFNGDGHLDMVSALFGGNSVGIFLGYGNGSFSPITILPPVPSSRAWYLTVGDVNNDNILDIVIANTGIDSIGVFLGYGNGSFSSSTLYHVGTNIRPISVAIGDLNNDSLPDIVTANYVGNGISIFFGYGNGSFQPLVVYSTGEGSLTRSVNICDVNNDGRLDIITANQGLSQVGVFLGYGNGSFQSQITFSTGNNTFPRYATTGDLNHDGYLDIAVANYGTASISVLNGYGNGTFGDLRTYNVGSTSNPTNLQLADFNKDNRLDIIIADEVSNTAGVFFGYDDGTFSSISAFSIGQGIVAYSVAVGDFNEDNYTDFVMTDSGNNMMRVFLANGSKPFGGQTIFPIGNNTGPCAIATGDFNNDHYLDIAVTNYYANNLAILFGQGNSKFSNLTFYSTGTNSQPISLTVNDLNNDTFSDIIIVNSYTNNVLVFIGHGDGNFSNFQSYSMGDNSFPVWVATGDFNRDHRLDTAVANFGTNNIQLLLGDGNGTFINQISYPLSYNANPGYIIFQDLNKDNRDDIIALLESADNMKILWNIC